MIEFGKRLKDVRLTLGLNVPEMSSKIGIEKNSYYKYEDGTRFPKPEVLLGLIQNFNINVNYLLIGKGEMFIQNRQSEKIKPHFNDIFPNISADKEVIELINSLEVPIMRNELLVQYLLYKKKYQDFIEEYFKQKEQSTGEEFNEDNRGKP